MKGIKERIIASVLAFAMAFTMIGFDLTSVLATEVGTEVVEEATEETIEETSEENEEDAAVSDDEKEEPETEDVKGDSKPSKKKIVKASNSDLVISVDVDKSKLNLVDKDDTDVAVDYKVKNSDNHYNDEIEYTYSTENGDVVSLEKGFWDGIQDWGGSTHFTVASKAAGIATVKVTGKYTYYKSRKWSVYHYVYSDKVVLTSSKEFQVVVYDSRVYTLKYDAANSTANTSIAYAIAEKGKTGFIFKKDYSKVGELVALSGTDKVKIGDDTDDYTALFFVKGDNTTTNEKLYVNGDAYTLVSLSEMQSTLNKKSGEWWDFCHWFDSKGFDIKGAVTAAANNGYKYIAVTKTMASLDNNNGSVPERENVLKVTAKANGSVSFELNGGTTTSDLKKLEEKKYFAGEAVSLPETPVKEGYRFVGWATSKDAVTGTTNVIFPNEESVVYYAVYVKNTYVVTFYDDNGIQYGNTAVVEYGDKVAKPTDPTKAKNQYAEFTFDKWVDESGVEFDFDTPIKSNVSLTATYTKKFFGYIYVKNAPGSEKEYTRLSKKVYINTTAGLEEMYAKPAENIYKKIENAVEGEEANKVVSFVNASDLPAGSKVIRFVKGEDNFHIDVTFAVTAENATISVPDVYYGDEAVATVKINDTVVSEENYDVKIMDGTEETTDYNKTPGTYTAVVSFKGKFSGTLSCDFDVVVLEADVFQNNVSDNTWSSSLGKAILVKEIYAMTQSEEWTGKSLTVSTDDAKIRTYLLSTPIDEEKHKVVYTKLAYFPNDKKAHWHLDCVIDEHTAAFYILNPGEVAPTDLKSDASKKYTSAGKGVLWLQTQDENKEPLAATLDTAKYIKTKPTTDKVKEVLLAQGYAKEEIDELALTINWYRIIKENDGWHVDGKVVDGDGNDYIRTAYTITWTQENGDVIYSENYYYGDKPVFNSEEYDIPADYEDDDYFYTFAGFNEDEYVTGDATYTAVFEKTEKDKAKVVFLNGEEIVSSLVVSKGYQGWAKVEIPEDLEGYETDYATYTFAGWFDSEGNMIESAEDVSLVAGEVTYLYAKFDEEVKEYTVTFVDENKVDILGTATYTYGQLMSERFYLIDTPTKEANDTFTFSFDKWVDFDGAEIAADATVTSDVTVYASYSEEYIDYTVTFNNEGTIVGTETYHYGESLMADGKVIPIPTKEADETCVYDFEKWVDENDAEIETVTSNITLYAKYIVTAIEDPNDDPDDPDDGDDDDNSDPDDDDDGNENDDPTDDPVVTPAVTPTVNPTDGPTDTDDAEEVEDAANSSDSDSDKADNKKSTTTIAESDIPLAAAEDNCIIHWIIFLLTIAFGMYNIVRIYARVHEDEKETETKKA